VDKVIAIGHGAIAYMIANDLSDTEMLGVLKDEEKINAREACRIKGMETTHTFKTPIILGRPKDIGSFLKTKETKFIVTFVQMDARRDAFEKLAALHIPLDRYCNLLHPTAFIPQGFSSIGTGILMAPYTQLSINTIIGNHCLLYANSFIGHDTVLEDYVCVANNASIGASVVLCKGVHIGSNASIREGVEVGEFSVVGMGSVVLQDVPPNSIVVGNPAKVLR